MYITVTPAIFADAFRNIGRENQFSREALEVLFEYLENYEEDTGTRVELDVVGLCCEFTEYSNAIEAAKEYDFVSELEAEDYNNPEDFEEAKESEAREWLEDRTSVIDFNGGLLIQNF